MGTSFFLAQGIHNKFPESISPTIYCWTKDVALHIPLNLLTLVSQLCVNRLKFNVQGRAYDMHIIVGNCFVTCRSLIFN